MENSLNCILNSENGVTAIEYALLGALIAVVIVVSVGMVGISVGLLYSDIRTMIVLAIR